MNKLKWNEIQYCILKKKCFINPTTLYGITTILLSLFVFQTEPGVLFQPPQGGSRVRFVRSRIWRAHREDPQISHESSQWYALLALGGVSQRLRSTFSWDLTMAGCSCHWLFSPLVSQLWSLDNIFSFNNELSKKVNSVDLWPRFLRPLRKPMPGMVRGTSGMKGLP